MRRPALPWIAFGLTTMCVLGAVLLPDDDWERNTITMLGVAVLFASACGALIASRRPDNAIGWILIAIGFSIASGLFATQWANRALIDAPGSLPGGSAAAWFQSWLWTPLSGLFALLVLLFPTGRALSRRWRLIGWFIGTGAAIVFVTTAFRPGTFETFRKVRNPLGIDLIGRAPDLLGALVGIWIVTIPAAMLSLFLRYRRARGVERQQLKWFFFAATAAIALVLSMPLIYLVNGNEDPIFLGVSIGFTFPVLAFTLLPAAIAIAILRLRLYDINRIISRTFSYAIVTVILGALYVVPVVILPATTLQSADASEATPDWVIAAVTLLVAALFRPVRRLVQNAVDRRFDRRRYDAENTIDAFAARMREEIDIDTLGAELVGVVHRTMQPSSASIWMRPRT